ncbi:RRXRR domain-containing protein [Sulfobacillus thermosulfidooxidans]|uniref:RRXRR domain-containing protein n=1 Tax=Sulfobacillus thermosulfidooxidans TaxID=28034 RepID=UPI000ADC9E6A|nr:RRXRR domain-containing protein [Sulfobacillus thermosulfidooxidans]
MRVFVLDTNRKPLDPCHPARARELLKKGKAVVFRRYPFTIILQDRTMEESIVHPHRIKIDSGSKTTGFAVLNESTNRVVWAAELEHRGEQIHSRMHDRASLRHGRRNRKTRYRKPRFRNRNPEKCIVCGKNARHKHKTCRNHAKEPSNMSVGSRWLPPSLESRVANTVTWTTRLIRLLPATAISMELVRFDLQKIENPEIQGVEYQQGTLFG